MKLNPKITAKIRTGNERGYVAECEEIAVVTQGNTLDEVVSNLKEAVLLHLEIVNGEVILNCAVQQQRENKL